MPDTAVIRAVALVRAVADVSVPMRGRGPPSTVATARGPRTPALRGPGYDADGLWRRRWAMDEVRLLDWVRRRTPRGAVPLARAISLLGATPPVWTAVGASALLAGIRSRGWGPLLNPICTLAVASAARRALAEMINRPRPPERLWLAPGRARASRRGTRPWAPWVPGWWPVRWHPSLGHSGWSGRWRAPSGSVVSCSGCTGRATSSPDGCSPRPPWRSRDAHVCPVWMVGG